jgi:hypothetical protein
MRPGTLRRGLDGFLVTVAMAAGTGAGAALRPLRMSCRREPTGHRESRR